VLSDPGRRRHYNHDLRESEQTPRPSVLRRSPAEPLVPRPPAIFDDGGKLRPSLEEFFDRYLRNFTGVGVPKAEREEGLNIEVVVSPEEAIHGGTLPVTLPVFRRCPVCRGTGEEWLFPCVACRAQGLIERREVVGVGIPPRVKPGTVVELPLRGLRLHNFYLRVHVLIGAH